MRRQTTTGNERTWRATNPIASEDGRGAVWAAGASTSRASDGGMGGEAELAGRNRSARKDNAATLCAAGVVCVGSEGKAIQTTVVGSAVKEH